MYKLFVLTLIISFSSTFVAADICCDHQSQESESQLTQGDCDHNKHDESEKNEDQENDHQDCSMTCSKCMTAVMASLVLPDHEFEVISTSFFYQDKNIKYYHERLMRPPTV